MTTLDIIRRAMRSIGVLRHSESPSASEAADALDTLNDMLNAWIHDGIDLEYLNVALTDTFAYPDDHIAAIRYNLAVELCGEYGKQIPPVVAANAVRYKASLQAKYCDPDLLEMDEALSPRYGVGVYRDFT